ncbi:MAG: YihY/virulence factor BrkB family protein [Thermoflexales bacterium]|nr:YihY/virulence factor BrkB family protein [Thermoflexales bacterium]
MNLKELGNLLKQAFQSWNEDKAARLAAALSFYAVFAIAPVLIIAVAIAGQVLGPAEVQMQLLNQLTATIGPQGADLIQSMLENARKPTDSLVASILAIITLILGAAGAFGQLQDALNTIWEVKARTGSVIRRLLAEKFLSFLMVMGLGLVLLAALIASTALSALNTPIGRPTTALTDLLGIINLFGSFGIIALVFAVILKVIPDVHIRWRDVWPGALLTAVLFTLGKYAIGLYLSHSSVGSAYGAAGSLVSVLLWIYYSAQIFLLGAEFTKVYARRSGSPVRPTPQAKAVTTESRAQEGLAPAQPPDHTASLR